MVQFVRGRLGSVSGGMDVEIMAMVRESEDGMEEMFVGFLPLKTPFRVVFLKFVIVLWEVSERESSTRGRAGGIVDVVMLLSPGDAQDESLITLSSQIANIK